MSDIISGKRDAITLLRNDGDGGFQGFGEARELFFSGDQNKFSCKYCAKALSKKVSLWTLDYFFGQLFHMPKNYTPLLIVHNKNGHYTHTHSHTKTT